MRYKVTPKVSPKKSDIASARKKAELSQTELANALHVGRATVQRWESGAFKMPTGLWELFLIKYEEKLAM